MPHVYRSGGWIPEFNGLVKGGLTVVIDRYEEIDGLRAICRLAGNPPEKPQLAVYRALQSSPLDLQAWQEWQRRRPMASTDQKTPESTGPIDDLDAIDAALELASEIWRSQSDELLCLGWSLPDPEVNPQAILEFQGENPGLLFHRGSLIVRLLKGTLKVPGFAITLWSGRGLAPSDRAENLVEDMRQKAQTLPAVEQLRRLDKWHGDINHLQAIIIFLHGLFSTDIGVFDGLIRKLKEDAEINNRVAMVGWPHDTLGGIAANAQMLRELIEDVVGPEGPSVAFVCHSRGGLVARSAAVHLLRNGPRWKNQLRGCVTFGTPHEGASLAEDPYEFIGVLLAVQSFRKANGFASLADSLYYLKHDETLSGVKDLRPSREESNFLYQLREDERRVAPEGQKRTLEVFAIGGVASTFGLPRALSWIVNRALRGDQHDLVVKFSSSASKFLGKTAQSHCDHFSYFADSEASKPYFNEAIAFLKERISRHGPGKAGHRLPRPAPVSSRDT